MSNVMTLPGSPTQIEFGFQQAREFILDPFYQHPVLTLFHTIEQNVVAKKQLAYLGLFGKSGIADTTCGGSGSQTLTASEKFWDPAPIRDRYEQCWNDIEPSLLVYAQKAGIDRKNLEMNPLFIRFISPLIRDNIVDNYLRRVWFSDTTYTSGDFTNGATDLPYYNTYNGFWQQIFAAVTAGDAYRSTITENAASTAAAQLTLGATTAYDALKDLYTNGDTRILEQNDAMILMTKSMFDNYTTYMESQSFNFTLDVLKDGFGNTVTRSTSFRGVPVYEVRFWDRWIQGDFLTGSPAVYDAPNRVLMTTKRNLAAGLDNTRSLSNFDSWYERKDQKWYADYGTVEDAKTIHDFMIAAAY